MITDEMHDQYCIAGFKNNKWYREHPLFKSYKEAVDYLKKHRNNSQFSKFTKFEIKHRKITLWENIEVEEILNE